MFGSAMLPREQDSLHFGFNPFTRLIDQILRLKIQGATKQENSVVAYGDVVTVIILEKTT
jgi:hypothetical protein